MAFGGIILFLGLVLDRLIGDPRTFLHPVALLGRFIGLWGRRQFYPAWAERFVGILGWLLTVAVALAPFIILYLFTPRVVFVVFSVLALAFCIGWRSLEEHVESVELALRNVCVDNTQNSNDKNCDEARRAVSYLVSRDTKNLTFEQIRSGAYESAAENLVDSIIAPIFWFVVFELIFGAGIFGAVLFRAANTMDAMLGYTDDRIRLGWFPARMDDILAFIPARVTGALLIVIFFFKGSHKDALRILSRDRKKRPGFNGGIPMSLIAGGCGVCFDKPNVYRIGDAKFSLAEGGQKIISVMRVTTVFAAIIGMILIISLSIFRLVPLV